jgi:hypothetical protein
MQMGADMNRKPKVLKGNRMGNGVLAIDTGMGRGLQKKHKQLVTCIRRPQHNTMGKNHDILFSTSTTTHQWHQTRWQENLSLLDTVAFTKNDFYF